jgi:hypothetical protein
VRFRGLTCSCSRNVASGRCFEIYHMKSKVTKSVSAAEDAALTINALNSRTFARIRLMAQERVRLRNGFGDFAYFQKVMDSNQR